MTNEGLLKRTVRIYSHDEVVSSKYEFLNGKLIIRTELAEGHRIPYVYITYKDSYVSKADSYLMVYYDNEEQVAHVSINISSVGSQSISEIEERLEYLNKQLTEAKEVETTLASLGMKILK